MGEKYSDWLKIDLHIHTDFSKKTKEDDYKGIFSIETLKGKLKENNVEIFSLTDHNIINIDAYKEYYESYQPDEDPLLLVGTELDIEVENNGKNNTYHSLLIFNYSDIKKTEDINNRLENKYLEKGCEEKNRVLTIDEIIELFPKDNFFFIPHAGNTKSIIDGYRGNIEDAQKMVLLMQSAFEKVQEKKRQIYNDGFNKVLYHSFQNQEDIAYIEFTDNHNIEQYPCTHKGENSKKHIFYYIKGSKNYETLRLAFIDPKSRIKSSEEYLKMNHSLNFIEKLKIKNESFIEDSALTFSPHLNVIIGGRSSGKSLLFNILGKKINNITLKDENKTRYNIINENILIKSKLDANFVISTLLTNDLVYLNQGDIIRYFEEKKLGELAKESNQFEIYSLALDNFKNHKLELERTINTFVNSYKNIYEADGITKKYILHRLTINNVLNENYIYKLNSNELKHKFNDDFQLDKTKNILKELIENVGAIINADILKFTEDEKQIIEEFSNLIKKKIELIIDKQLVKNRRDNFINEINKLINEKNNTLNTEAKQKNEANEVLFELKNSVFNRFKRLVDLKNKSYLLQDFNYNKIEKIQINEDVSLVLEIEMLQSLKEKILNGLNDANLEQSLFINTLNLLNNKCSIKNYPNDLSSQTLDKKIKKELEDIFIKIETPEDYLVYSDGSTSKANSPGYNSEKYMEIILKNHNNKLIFIDQPEDNLGNKFIAEDLVALLRILKFQKQIFLVTHNPSIVVYGDAENIIIANNDDNKISYKQIVLEDQNAQKEICSILDGGEYIFNNRARKYNIKRILQEDKKNE